MTVYIVKAQSTNVDDPSIDAIFSTKELAEAHAEKEKKNYYYGTWVEEYQLDSGDWV